MFNIVLLAGAMFALGMDAYVLAGLMPDIATTFDVSEGAAAQVVTAFTLCYAIASPILAAILAGKPVKLILGLAMALFVIGNLVSAWTTGYTMLIVSRCIAGAGAGIFAPVAAAVASSLVPKEQKGRAIGMILGGMGTGTVVGVPLGIEMAHALGWQSTLLLVAIIGVITVFAALAKLPALEVAPPPSLSARVKMLASPRISLIVMVTLFTAIASLGLYTFMAPLLTDLGRISHESLYLWVWGVGGVVGAFSVGHLIDKTGRPGMVLLVILIVMTTSLALLPLAGSLPLLISFLPFLCWGAMGWSSLAPQQHVLLGIQKNHGAVAVALNSSANYLGSAIGSMLGGTALTHGIMCLSHLAMGAAIAALIAVMLQTVVMVLGLNKNPKG